MLSSTLRSSSVIWILSFVFCFCSAFQPVCLARIYGIPNYRDCMSAWLSMPFARDPSGRFNPRRPELFSEPQYLLPPFARITNRYQPLPINQLPKIWRSSTLMSTPPPDFVIQCLGARSLLHPLTRGFPDTCRVALMSSGRSGHSVASSLWTAYWEYILNEMQVLFVCGSPRSGTNPSGGYMALAST